MSSDLRFSVEHEWVLLDGDIATIGISDFAQQQLGDVVFIELPDVGRTVERGAEVAVVESVKAASEIYVPLSGEIVDEFFKTFDLIFKIAYFDRQSPFENFNFINF